jgi:hypothetical protein
MSLVLMLLTSDNENNPSLITKIDNLEKENRKLKNEVDDLEQYGRRCSSGLPTLCERMILVIS